MPSAPTSLRPDRVSPVSLRRIAALCGLGDPTVDVALTGITHDSRAVRPGDLYAALPGQRAHGADFVSQALAAGAVAVLTDPAGAQSLPDVPRLVVEDPRRRLGQIAAAVYGDPCQGLLVIGVTGTNGKTTTSYLVDAALRAAGHRTGLIGTIETRVGEQSVISARTTPEATDLQALLALMREREVSAVVMEVSSHALALGRVGGMRFDAVGFTGLSQDHLDFHRDMEDYFEAKAALFTREYAERGVILVHDEWGARLLRRTEIPAASLGRGEHAQWRIVDERALPVGSAFALRSGELALDCTVQLPGEFNVANAALAIALVAGAGGSPDAAAEGVAGLIAVPGRMEPVEAGQPFRALVDYAHTPDAVDRVLDECRRLAGGMGRVIGVLGCGGDRDAAKRPAMGAALARGADLAVLTSDNPRSEDPLTILEQMRSGAAGATAALVEPDRAKAIQRAVAAATPEDVLVVLGKGHETGQEIDGTVHPFDDRIVLREAIEAKSAG